MKLVETDKARYSGNFKLVFAGIVVVLSLVALASSAILIEWFGSAGESNFWLNPSGVVIAAVCVFLILRRLRTHPFMTEVVYVWDLKQLLNRIYRKERKLQAAVEANDPDAMVIMNFFLRGSRQLYELDNNLITHDELVDRIRQHDKRLEAVGLTVSTDTFDVLMLERFEAD